MKSLKIITLIGTGLMFAACSTSATKSTITHVKDLVQSDVFAVLPEANLDIVIYNNAEEIDGEYLELATVNIQEVNAEDPDQSLEELLKKEARELGGNGVLLVESNTNEKGNLVTKQVKAIAVYKLEKIPGDDQLVLL